MTRALPVAVVQAARMRSAPATQLALLPELQAYVTFAVPVASSVAVAVGVPVAFTSPYGAVKVTVPVPGLPCASSAVADTLALVPSLRRVATSTLREMLAVVVLAVVLVHAAISQAASAAVGSANLRNEITSSSRLDGDPAAGVPRAISPSPKGYEGHAGVGSIF